MYVPLEITKIENNPFLFFYLFILQESFLAKSDVASVAFEERWTFVGILFTKYNLVLLF